MKSQQKSVAQFPGLAGLVTKRGCRGALQHALLQLLPTPQNMAQCRVQGRGAGVVTAATLARGVEGGPRESCQPPGTLDTESRLNMSFLPIYAGME